MSAAEEDIHELDSETENDGLNDVEMCLMSEVGEFVHLYIKSRHSERKNNILACK